MIARSSPILLTPLAAQGRSATRRAFRRVSAASLAAALVLLPACSGTWKGLSDDASSIFGDEEKEQTERVTVERVDEVVSIAELQQLLDEQGYDPGAVDGIFGERTARAIRSYQVNNGLRVTGRPSAALVERLRATGSAPAETIEEIEE